MDIQWKLVRKNINEIKEYENNPRILTQERLKHLEDSIRKFGCAEPIIINTDNVICGGHGRKKTLEKLDVKEVDCYMPNRTLTEKEFDELNIRLNKNVAGVFDYDMLANRFDFAELEEIGFTAREFDADSEALKKLNEYDFSDDTYTPDDEGFQNAIIQYALVFDNGEQQHNWYTFLKQLQEKYPELETHAQRIDHYLKTTQGIQGTQGEKSNEEG